MGAEDQIHFRMFLPNSLLFDLLLGHAAADANEKFWFFFLEHPQLGNFSIDFALWVFPYRAGVKKNKISFLFPLCGTVAQ